MGLLQQAVDRREEVAAAMAIGDAVVRGQRYGHDRSGHELELRRGQSAFLSAADAGVSITGHGTVLRAAVGAVRSAA